MKVLKIKKLTEDEYIENLKNNFISLISGWLPKGNKKNLLRYECLKFYLAAASKQKIKKVPFFVYWLIIKREKLDTGMRIRELKKSNCFISHPTWLKVEDDLNKIWKLLYNDPHHKKESLRLLKAIDNYSDYSKKYFKRYQSKQVAWHAYIRLMVPIFSPICDEVLQYVNKNKYVEYYKLRRYKKSLQKIHPEIVKMVLLNLEDEGKIKIHFFSGSIFLQSLKPC